MRPRGQPQFKTSGSADMTVPIEFYAGSNPGTNPSCSSCGCAEVTISGGKITGARVMIYESAAGGGTGPHGECTAQNLFKLITHELGHVLGLKDHSGGGCNNRVMKNPTRPPSNNDCDAVDNIFVVQGENDNDGSCVPQF